MHFVLGYQKHCFYNHVWRTGVEALLAFSGLAGIDVFLCIFKIHVVGVNGATVKCMVSKIFSRSIYTTFVYNLKLVVLFQI